MQKLKVKDEVVVLAGKEKGKTGELLKLNLKTNKVLVKGVNMVKKTLKATQENPQGSIVEKEAFLHISNIALISPKTKKATRVKIVEKDGKNVRMAVACKTILK
jgi:large subunit ribosomal protein L24